jgi:hypothetical protein
MTQSLEISPFTQLILPTLFRLPNRSQGLSLRKRKIFSMGGKGAGVIAVMKKNRVPWDFMQHAKCRSSRTNGKSPKLVLPPAPC